MIVVILQYALFGTEVKLGIMHGRRRAVCEVSIDIVFYIYILGC